jgi:hypothetical protein
VVVVEQPLRSESPESEKESIRSSSPSKMGDKDKWEKRAKSIDDVRHNLQEGSQKPQPQLRDGLKSMDNVAKSIQHSPPTSSVHDRSPSSTEVRKITEISKWLTYIHILYLHFASLSSCIEWKSKGILVSIN